MFKHLIITRPVVFLDAETTGLLVDADRVVELGLVRVSAAGAVRRSWRLDPGAPIPAAATAVHGIADADVVGRPRFGEVADEVLTRIDGCDLAGFNLLGYDLPMVAAELRRCGLDPDSLLEPERRCLDVMRVYHALTPWRRGAPRNLSAAVATFLGRRHVGAHGAVDDALAAAEVLDAMVDHFALPRPFDELCEMFAEGPHGRW